MTQFVNITRETNKSRAHFTMRRWYNPLQSLHMDLFGPMRTTSFGGKNIIFANVNDFSRFT